MQQLKDAAVSGLVFGVKWAIAVAIIALVAMLLSGDYLMTRQRSINGQAAYEYIAKVVSEQQAKQQPPADAVKK